MPATPPPSASILRERCLTPGSLWHRIDVVAASGSTNADLAALAREGAEHGTVLLTDNQTAGRGRFTRAWTTPPGVSLACSMLLRPQQPPPRWTWLPLLTGVAVARGVREASGLDVGLKWPNDVLVGERKLCGLLAERHDTPDGPAAIIGLGINISMDATELPVPTATSLLLEGAEVDKTAVAAAVLEAFADAYRQWIEDQAALVAAYEALCVTLGREVRIQLSPENGVEGTAVGVDEIGALRLRTAAGTRTFSAGDVLHLRPATLRE